MISIHIFSSFLILWFALPSHRWLLPHKGESLQDNGWVLVIPLLRYVLATGVVAVSCCVTCGYTDAFDIVLNSLAFTFISEVGAAG